MNNECLQKNYPKASWREKDFVDKLEKLHKIEMQYEPKLASTYQQVEQMDDESVLEHASKLYPAWCKNPLMTWEQVTKKLEPPLETT